MIKLLQTNCNRSTVSHNMVDDIARRRGVDICLYSEPNRGRISGDSWIKDISGDAAIEDRCGAGRAKGSGRGYCWLDIGLRCRVYSCYSSPNGTLEDLGDLLDELARSIGDCPDRIIVITGDFNASSESWGARRTDRRGAMLFDWLASCELCTVNSGDTPTFQRGLQSSYLDLTICRERDATRVRSWEVLDSEENLSDHHCIESTIVAGLSEDTSNVLRRTKLVFQGAQATERAIRAIINSEGNPADLEGLNTILQRACTEARVHSRRRRPVPQKPWWNEEIAEARRAAMRCRRALKNAARRIPDNINTALAEYREKRARLRQEIEKSKKACWNNLLTTLQEDPWGEPYRLVRNKLRSARPPLIPKDGNKYRPICLLNTLAKGFEIIIETRLRERAGELHWMSRRQYGFRPSNLLSWRDRDENGSAVQIRDCEFLKHFSSIRYYLDLLLNRSM